ncbi:mannosyl-3-phosphoglycerate phosphatase [Gilvimarinus sp. DA14]|uniref:HAD-IIB family hydrolase n=1 Tax=Gilvimarinus sp. DA14 TaxID=2956798 RepID=UPI0020B72051|nr:HAD-IIB family hydrolase [Gilvimarinus sp. DA14]UTF59989.1 HAD-IIB family hydrolase [Gilvimarinus sp. DA14]
MAKPIAVFTDLDGTLLNHHDYSYADALPAINHLKKQNIPLVLVSSKTQAEMSALCQELSLTSPYVCENGSLIVMPAPERQRLGVELENAEQQGDDFLIYRGANREEIVRILAQLKRTFSFTGFADMSVHDVVNCTGLSEQAAAKAMTRAASEPLLWHQDEADLADFAQHLRKHNLRVLKGGRFYHVMATCDKGDAVRYLLSLYESYYGARVASIALGDSPNDLQMLKAVDQSVVMPHPDGTYMHDDSLTNAIRAPFEGARGWREGVEEALAGLTEHEEAP